MRKFSLFFWGNWGVVLDWELVLNQWADEYDASIHNDGF
jgi:hypothetical protein